MISPFRLFRFIPSGLAVRLLRFLLPAAALAVALWVVGGAYPLLLFLGALAWFARRRVPAGAWAVLLPSVCFGTLLFACGHVLAPAPGDLRAQLLAAFSLAEPPSLAARLARAGFLAGALVGAWYAFTGAAGRLSGRLADLWYALAGHGGRRHAPGVVRGQKVLEGGWASCADLADRCDFGPPREGKGGIVLGKLEGRVVRVIPEKGKVKMAGHAVVIGASGTGKSYTYVRNNIIAAALAGESLVISDPKGELCLDMAGWLRQKGYNVIVFNVMDPVHSHRWNMIAECRDEDELLDLADVMISCAGDDHAFFAGGEKNVLTAAMGYARWGLPEGYRHIRQALSLLSWPPEALGEAFAKSYRAGEIPQAIYETFAAAQGHWPNYVEGVRNKLRTITKGPLAALTAASDFTLASVGREKTALFCILPTDGDYRMLLAPFYTFFFRRLKELALSSPGGRLPVPVRFILDEFANIGRIPDLEKVTAVARGMGVQVQIILQNIGQVQGLYAKEKRWQAVVGNCPVRVCLSCDDLETAAWFTRAFGAAVVEHETWRKDTTPGKMNWLEPPKTAITRKKEAIMEPWELLQLPEDDMVAHVRGKPPAYMQKLPWTALPQAREIQALAAQSMDEVCPPRDTRVAVLPVPEPGEREEPQRARVSGSGSAGKAKAPRPAPEPEPDPGVADELGI